MKRPKRRVELPGRECVHPGGRRKSSYRSIAKARQAIKLHGSPTRKLYPYECPVCHLWHVTGQKPRGAD